MGSLSEFNFYGEEIEKLVMLRTSPIAVKMIKDEIIFSVPQDKVERLVSQLRMFEERKFGYRHHAFWEMRPDFPRPDFYKRLFRECGLDADDIPTWPTP